MSNALTTTRKSAPVSRFSSKFLDTHSTRRASCSAVLCLGVNPNCSSRNSPRALTSWSILERRIFQTVCQSCLIDLWVGKMRAVPGLYQVSRLKTHVRASNSPGSTEFDRSRD